MKNQLIQWIDARDKPGLLYAMMKEFTNKSQISFEGDLSALNFTTLPNASTKETDSLKRQTTEPELNFIILPLTTETFHNIWHELSEKDHLVNEGIIHVQIATKEELAFGAYDNFHKECTVAYPLVPTELLQNLKDTGIIRGYEERNT